MKLISLLDNDLYKFTMQYAVTRLFPEAKARYSFINRDNTVFPDNFDKILRGVVEQMADLRANDEELEYFRSVAYYLPPTYFDFLRGYRYNPDEVCIKFENGKLSVNIEGYWYRTILWEVPLLAIISELYFEQTKHQRYDDNTIAEITKNKAELFASLNVNFADFGTRRRYSFENHDRVVEILKQYAPNNFVGTSNVFLAYKYNLTPIGTQAHEWIMFHAAKYGFLVANQLSLENWVEVYRGNLGIALSDTLTTEAFFGCFDTKLAKLFDGVRQDSGDPFEFGEKLIEHYHKLRIDPTTKTIIFSDSLTPQLVEQLTERFKGRIRLSFGIGTNLTNDVGVKPLNIVIKMIEAMPDGRKWIPTIKLSDSPGKYSGDSHMIEIALKTLDLDNRCC